METITYSEFLEYQKRNSYYEGRWAYIEEVIKIVRERKPQSALELGPSLFTVIKNADIMHKPEIDMWGIPTNITSKTYPHDATIFPWPFEDRQYDMFVALQVFEHLYDKQAQAFQEAKRIAKSIVLSLPYKWDCTKAHAGYMPSHHMIDEDVILKWAGGERPAKTIYIDRAGEAISKGPRIICYWEF